MARRARPREGRSRRHAGDRRRGGREDHDRAVGLSLLRREGPQARSTTSTRDEVKQYLQLDKLREAMFFVAGELFGFRFTPVPDGDGPGLPPGREGLGGHRQDIGQPRRALVSRSLRAARQALGRLGDDAIAATRPSTASEDGARGPTTRTSSRGRPGEPVLVSWADAETFFHEFGHALHALLVEGRLSDLERRRARLHRVPVAASGALAADRRGDQRPISSTTKTGEPIPADAGRQDQEGGDLQPGLRDDGVPRLRDHGHEVPHDRIRPGSTPTRSSARRSPSWGCRREISMRHRSPQFGHVFSSEGYAAGLLRLPVGRRAHRRMRPRRSQQAPGGYYDKALAKKLVEQPVPPCATRWIPAEAYRAFRGRDAKIDALMRDRGFPVPGGSAGAGGS